MEQKDYSALLPTKPPEGLTDWLIDKGEFEKEYLVYKNVWGTNPHTNRKERMEKLVCTACEKVIYADVVNDHFNNVEFVDIHTRETIPDACPHCGVKAQKIHSSELSKFRCAVKVLPITITKAENNLAICCWYVEKMFYKNGTSEIYSYPYESYVVEKRKIVRLNAWKGTYDSSNPRLTGRWEQRKTFRDMLGRVNLVYPWDSSLLDGTTVENSKLDLFFQSNEIVHPIQYLKLYQKHPNIENLLVQGAGHLAQELIDHASYRGGHSSFGLNDILWNENRPAQMLGLDKGEFKRLVAEKWGSERLSIYHILKKEGHSVTVEQLALCKKLLGRTVVLELLEQGKNPVFIAQYLKKQQAKDSRNDYRILKDYWNMMVIAGNELENHDILFPSRLYQAHDRAMREAKEVKIRVNDEKMKQRKKLLSKFMWEKDGILIRPAQSEQDLKEEGEKLHHCVHRYANRVARGETAIFFIRRTETPDEPWYTLELDETNLKVKQNRGNHNCERTDEIKAFEQAWLEHIRAIAQKKKSKKGRNVA